MSKLEDKIAGILRENEIYFEREVVAHDLRNGLLRFDFYIPVYHMFIEVNGQQHYQFTKHFFKNKSEFLKAQERDRIKISYALANSYKLYIFPYFDMPKNIKDFFNDKYLAKNKFHNDTTFREFDKERKL